VALDDVFSWMATEFDASLIEGMNAAIAGGLIWARPQLGVALSLYVIGYAFLMMYGKTDGWSFASATARAMTIGAILGSANYNYYVRDFFFTDLPNQIAVALNGPRITVNSAQQFDIVRSAALHYTSYILAQATGWTSFAERFLVRMIDGFNTAMLIACFGMWYISRVFMAVVICLGPFLIIGALFKGTRGFVFQWIGKLIGLTMLGLASSIVLRVVLAIISARLRSVEINPSMSIDEMIVTATGISTVLFLGTLVMVALPSAVAFGSSVAASSAVASSLLGSSVSAAADVARAAAVGAARGAAKGVKAIKSASSKIRRD
jgi:type IV secretory pathway VirB6-like protein